MDYYQISRKASSETGDHQGLIYLKNLGLNSQKILDVGCGEGTRLNTLLPKGKRGWGIDPNPKAIIKAKRQFPHHYFQQGTGEKLPYKDNFFDLVYSAFAIEHCSHPQKFIQEMNRVTNPGGKIAILAPNYGAPNRRSPNSQENPYNKFLEGLLKDFFPQPNLDWRQVTPSQKYSQIDADTTWEPYLGSLIHYLKSLSLSINNISSLWSLESESNNFRKNLFRQLGQLKIYPFKYWGPQVFIVAVK
jgi:ubiquinone/menaquinone biosynthesis C-methylase UbiE